jgi:hypothetical protein
MATELLSRASIKSKDTILKPQPPAQKELSNAPSLKQKLEILKKNPQSTEDIKQSVSNGIDSFENQNKAELDQLYNSSELIFTKIVEDMMKDLSSSSAGGEQITQYLSNLGITDSNHNPNASVGVMKNEIFRSKSSNEDFKLEDLARLATSTKAGINYQHHLSQKIIVIQKLISIAKANKVIVDQTKINQFFSYYDSVEKEVTNSQKILAHQQEPYNGYTLGYHEMVTNPTKYITDNFRVNPYYNTGDIVSSIEEGADIKEIGLIAERKINSAISDIEGVVMVVAGPNFSILDTVSKVDSLSFYSPNPIEESVKSRLVELSYQISYATYQDSLIKDYQEADPKKIRKHEVVPRSYVDATNNLKLSEQGITVYSNDANEIQQKIDDLNVLITQNLNKAEELKSKSNKADKSALKTIEKIKKPNEEYKAQIAQLNIELLSLNLIIEDKQNSINNLKTEAQSIYENYNPQGLAIPLALSPQGQIEVYQDGLKVFYKQDNYSDYSEPKDSQVLEDEFNSLLIKHNIRVNAIQIKQNANVPRVKEAIATGKITGAIGTSMDYASEPTTLKQAIAMSLNIDDTAQTLSTPLSSTSKKRS